MMLCNSCNGQIRPWGACHCVELSQKAYITELEKKVIRLQKELIDARLAGRKADSSSVDFDLAPHLREE